MNLITNLIFFILLLYPEISLAADSSKSAFPSSAGAAFWITFAIVYFSRKRAIGGWLFYYYFKLYIGAFISLIFLIMNISKFELSAWSSNYYLLAMYFLSTYPFYIIEVFEIIFASKLLNYGNRELVHVNKLRTVLKIMIAVTILQLAIDLFYFPESSVFSTFAVTSAIIWYVYFKVSRRVDWVLIRNKWNYDDFQLFKKTNIIIENESETAAKP